ncbi:hypothetical protein POKY_59 [Escherichia phage vB_EcoD_Poky]|uniref:Uncharacterized protein n=1 Tax=Escherichia phage vB_EcoD_Poky TaxID=2902673 RepID=A0AC61TPE8_9CAUD|nr:hypothetical protein POKY_59 [Escherichia phage vB_EcoD_Poky]
MLDVIKKAHEMGMDVSICDASARHPSAPENMVVVIVHNHRYECRAMFEKHDKESQRCFINEVCDLYGRI